MERLLRIGHRATIVLLFAVLFFYGLSQARLVLYPLVLGVLFSYLLYPVASGLESRGVPRIVANLASILLGLVVIGGVAYLVFYQLNLLLENLPELKEQARKNLDEIGQALASTFQVSESKFDSWVDDQAKNATGSGSALMNTIFPMTTSTLMALGLLPVYVFLFLFYRNKFEQFIYMVVPVEKHQRARSLIEAVSKVTKKYMGGVFLVVLILCFLNSIGLLLIGLKFAVLFGVLSAICNFIPYFGTLIGAVFPLAMAVFTGDSASQAVHVLLLFVAIQFIENNILTPNITGGSVQINPLVTIITLIVGGMVWGVPGMFVVVPIMGAIKIACEHHEATKPIAYLLGTEGSEKHAISKGKIKKFFGQLFSK